jgi:uncharacterized protein (DUF1778 family)
MANKADRSGATKPVQLRIRKDISDLIDRAAGVNGKTRSEFMIDASRRAAEDALLDQTFVQVDDESFRRYMEILDKAPEGEGFTRLMNVAKPWG